MPMFFIIILALYLGGNAYIFIRGLQTVPGLPLSAKIAVGIVYWLCALFFFVIFRSRGALISETTTHILYVIGTSWLLFTLYMVLMLLAIDILKLFGVQWTYSFYVAFGLTALLLIYGSYNYRHPKVKEVNIGINKLLTTGERQLKVVGISDVHLGHGTGKEKLKRYVELINAQKPDLIIIGGDLVDNDLTPLYVQHMEEELSQLKAPMGIYMVPGNHENFGGGVDKVADFLLQTPVVLLQDSLVRLPNGLQIIGRKDRSSRSRKEIKEWKPYINQGNPVIILDHQPYDFHLAEEAKVDFQFSGHTHRGQIWPLSLITDAMFEHSYGYLQRGCTHFYVSSGLSLWGPPFRIGTDSEVVVFNFTFDE